AERAGAEDTKNPRASDSTTSDRRSAAPQTAGDLAPPRDGCGHSRAAIAMRTSVASSRRARVTAELGARGPGGLGVFGHLRGQIARVGDPHVADGSVGLAHGLE